MRPILCSSPAGRAAPAADSVNLSRHWQEPAAAIGVAAIFMETHPDPDNAPSDGPNMVPMDQFEDLLRDIKRFDDLAKEG